MVDMDVVAHRVGARARRAACSVMGRARPPCTWFCAWPRVALQPHSACQRLTRPYGAAGRQRVVDMGAPALSITAKHAFEQVHVFWHPSQHVAVCPMLLNGAG